MSDGRPIGVFDSGLGGLTVLRALIDLLPQQPFIYFGDTGRFPYGSKPAEEVTKYAIQITDLLLDREVQMVVVACNHYPLLARTIGDVMGPDVVLVSSADETAFEVCRLLASTRSQAATPSQATTATPRHRFLTSGDARTFERLGARFCGPEVG